MRYSSTFSMLKADGNWWIYNKLFTSSPIGSEADGRLVALLDTFVSVHWARSFDQLVNVIWNCRSS